MFGHSSVLGRDSGGFAEMFLRFSEPAILHHDDAKIIMRDAVIGVQP